MKITTTTCNTSKEKGSIQAFMVLEYAIKGSKVYFMVISFLAIVLDIEQWNTNTLQENKY